MCFDYELLTVFVCSQAGICRQMRPACCLVAVGRSKFVADVRSMEKRGEKISWNTFKEAGALFDPSDVIRFVSLPAAKVTTLRQLVANLRPAELWTQILLHPELPRELINPSHRMSLYACVCCRHARMNQCIHMTVFLSHLSLGAIAPNC